jgi:hypothetical protein
MIEGATFDYDRVESSTATEDGNRIVITLAAERGPTSISLPTSEVARLILAISTATGMAVAAHTGRSLAPVLPVRKLRLGPSEADDDVHFAVELHGGAQMVFQTDRPTAAEFMHDWIQMLELENSPRSIQ